ncbi:AGL317Cp [Eremothecium gossypii ATCC 10895]|uniref:AGL317Cp n=1 Tax=Eremothecium gossypii (strain ATCC 10895 / CBS 109.51 / FGSC 9923 / NRRL Y-1056) TaxID=284811 RepID=Q751S1_EREGS|nr:mitochondrial 37S ribosomal protein RSM26 [Eremothecium gossypii ATCC 10895]AAS54174.1 AGL317Cp [Eremothecium gossypii ATCC 10895]AEY98500.1 FAGL317Cp [Eremothecium gossypii FDAG1]
MFRFAPRRAVHTVPKLAQLSELHAQGIPKVLSAEGFRRCWTEQQQYLCEKLTLATAGTPLESYLPFHLVLNTAQKTFKSNVFNLASAVHNNHLFVENILPAEGAGAKPSIQLLQRIESQFGFGWEELKEEMVRRAETDVVGQGWLFLVENGHKELQILTLQNHGSPYYFARGQAFDLNSPITTEIAAQLQTMREAVDAGNDEDWTMPLIAVSLWDHAYLRDYGVKGRSAYVRAVLDNLNWTVINKRVYTGP